MNEILKGYLSTKIYSISDDDYIYAYFSWLKCVMRDLIKYSDQIDLITINSNKSLIELFEHNNEYTIIWDTAYWDYYANFLKLMIMALDKGSPFVDPNLHQRAQEHELYQYLYNRTKSKSKNKKKSDFYYSKAESARVKIDFQETYDERLYDNCLAVAKMFTLFHELEHIFTDINPDLTKEEGMKIEKLIDHLVDTEIIDVNIDGFLRQIKGKEYFEEIICDYLAFFEVLTMLAYELDNAAGVFSQYKKISDAVRMLMLFNNQLNSINVLSNYYVKGVKIEEQSYCEDYSDSMNQYFVRSSALVTFMPNIIGSFAFEQGVECDLHDIYKQVLFPSERDAVNVLGKIIDYNVAKLRNDLFGF